MSEALFDFFIYNDVEYPTHKFDNYYRDTQPSIYEVIRIIDSIPLFLEEHYLRLRKSAEILGYELNIDISSIKNNIEKVIKLNNVKENNIKIIVNGFGEIINTYYFLIKSSYPLKEQYSEGIKTILYHSTRENPNAKVIIKNMREDVNLKLKESSSYEALLLNKDLEITEGSRSNVFFIKGDTLYTAPAEAVLMGITRKRILNLCEKNNIKVIEAPILSSELACFDAAFISGTSPKILPIASVEDINYSIKNSLLVNLMKIYDDEINTYIANH